SDPLMSLHAPSGMEATDDGLWIASTGSLMHVGFDMHTNLQLALPVSKRTPVTALRHDSDRIWISTHGEGLIEYDKRTHSFRQFTEKDGLLMNHVASFGRQQDTVWIGFGEGKSALDMAWSNKQGGLG